MWFISYKHRIHSRILIELNFIFKALHMEYSLVNSARVKIDCMKQALFILIKGAQLPNKVSPTLLLK